ncbi:MAG: hypothetical protein NZN45_01055, partial [Rhodovarius sp.]|nr:hypothetical protein [Rhodovarius sp.]
MTLPDANPDPAALRAFLRLAGAEAWGRRLSALDRKVRERSFAGRAAQQRHAAELMLARMVDAAGARPSGTPERRVAAFAQEVAELAAALPGPARARLRALVREGLQGEATLIPLFHLVRTAALARSRGFAVRFDGLLEGATHDLLIERDGAAAEVVCAVVSAEEGRPLNRGAWFDLMDAIHPELQTWLASHPGRYLLKMTLPEGVQTQAQLAALQRRILDMLAAERRQDASADAVLKLDPLLLAGAQASLPAALRAQFGPEAHLAVTSHPASGSVFVMAARAGRENEIAQAVKLRLAEQAERLSGRRPGILAVFIEDLERHEWRSLRETLALEGAVRRFFTEPPAARVVAVSVCSRAELFGLP